LSKNNKRHDSAYIQLGRGDAKAEFMSFTVYARIRSKRRSSTYHSIPMRFAINGKCFKIYVPVNKWRRIIIKFDEKFPAPSWKTLRLLEPGRITNKKIMAISYEINDMAVYTSTPAPRPKPKKAVSKSKKSKRKPKRKSKKKKKK